MPTSWLLYALLLAQTQTFTEPPVYVTAIDLVTTVRDANGNVPRDLKPEDFVVLEDGKEMPVIGIEYLDAENAKSVENGGTADASGPNEWQTVVYFDLTTTTQQHRNLIVETLTKNADDLTKRGTVEIVAATPVPGLVLEATRDPNAVRAALKKVAKFGSSNWIVTNRRIFLTEVDNTADVSTTRRIAQAVNAVRPGVILTFLVQEAELVSRFQRNLFGWISRYPRHVPRALLLVTDGFELDPVPFYSQNSNDVDMIMQVRAELDRRGLIQQNADTAQILAAAGWTTVSVAAAMAAGAIGRTTFRAARSAACANSPARIRRRSSPLT